MHHDLIHIFGYLGVDTRNETVEQIQARFESLRDYQKVEFEVVRGILPAELADYVIKSEPDVYFGYCQECPEASAIYRNLHIPNKLKVFFHHARVSTHSKGKRSFYCEHCKKDLKQVSHFFNTLLIFLNYKLFLIRLQNGGNIHVSKTETLTNLLRTPS